MRIALATRFAWPSVGGMETKVRTIANALAERAEVAVHAHHVGGGVVWRNSVDRGEPFAPITDPESGVVITQLRLTAADLALLAPCLTPLMPRDIGRRRRLDPARAGAERWHTTVAGRRFAAQLGHPDVLHRFGGNRMTLALVAAARRIGCPAVITPNAHPGQWDDDPVSGLAYRRADVVVATCRADARTYVDLGVDPARIAICPEPSHPVARGGGAELRRARGIEGELVVFIGARRPYKGVDVLLAAAERLAEERPSARVAFVGPGPALAARAGNVLDVGEVQAAERDAWIDAADVVCLPSRAESWGLVVSEAWSAATPVVTSDIPVLRERVGETEGGLAVAAQPRTLAQALGALLGDAPARRRMGRAGRAEWEARLSPAAVADWHAATYERLLADRPGQGGAQRGWRMTGRRAAAASSRRRTGVV